MKYKYKEQKNICGLTWCALAKCKLQNRDFRKQEDFRGIMLEK